MRIYREWTYFEILSLLIKFTSVKFLSYPIPIQMIIEKRMIDNLELSSKTAI